jgi:uncharacterized HhH-GPD family protein
VPTLTLTGDPDADRLLSENPFALLVGMLLDQQIAMELAFVGPHGWRSGSDGPSTPRRSPRPTPDELEALFRRSRRCTATPGRWPSASTRSRSTWSSTTTATPPRSGRDAGRRELKRRLKALPGVRRPEGRIFVALLGKQCGSRPTGGGRPPATTASTATARSPTSPRETRSRRSASGSRRPRPPRRPLKAARADPRGPYSGTTVNENSTSVASPMASMPAGGPAPATAPRGHTASTRHEQRAARSGRAGPRSCRVGGSGSVGSSCTDGTATPGRAR